MQDGGDMVSQLSVQNITLRPAIAADVDWAAPLMFAAGPALFSYVFASPPDQSQKILQQAFVCPRHSFSYEFTQVVEVGQQPAGMMLSYSGARKRQADEKVQSVMAKFLPLRKLPKILMNVADLTRIKQDVLPEDYYIFSLSVLPEFQNQGVGTYLLHQAERQAQASGCRAVCLDVAFTNTRAKALFERHDYRVTCSKSTDRFEQMTRAGGLHRMVKLL